MTSHLVARVAQRYASRHLTVYHGTNNAWLSRIQTNGLVSPNGYSNAAWYMVAEDFESAKFHSGNADEEGLINPIVIEFRIPVEEGSKWPGYPYLWKPRNLQWEGSATRWFALRQVIPPEFIVRVHR